MATLWKFYPPHPELASASITAVAAGGTSTTLANLNDNRRLSRMDVDTLGTYVSGADELFFRIDYGSGVTKQVDFIGIVEHNLYQETGAIRIYYDISDNAALTNAAALLGAQTAVSTDEPIWLESGVTPVSAKRYYWILFDSIAATAYAGELLLGSAVEPLVDPSWGTTTEVDIESGRIVNTSPGGYNWKTRTHGTKKIWQVRYELVSDSDKAILDTLWDDDHVDTPFIFTNDGGTTFYYGELVGSPVWESAQQDLHNVEFTISEVIA